MMTCDGCLRDGRRTVARDYCFYCGWKVSEAYGYEPIVIEKAEETESEKCIMELLSKGDKPCGNG